MTDRDDYFSYRDSEELGYEPPSPEEEIAARVAYIAEQQAG